MLGPLITALSSRDFLSNVQLPIKTSRKQTCHALLPSTINNLINNTLVTWVLDSDLVESNRRNKGISLKYREIRSPSMYWFHRKNWISQPQLEIEPNQSTSKPTTSIEDFHSQYLRIGNRSSTTTTALTYDSSTATLPSFENGNENSIKKLFDDNNRSSGSNSNTGKNKENSGLLPSSWSTTTSGNKKLYPSDESGYNNNNNIITKKLISSTNKGRMLVDDDGVVAAADSGDTETTLASGSSTLLSGQKRKDNNFIVDAVSKSSCAASGEVNNKNEQEKTKHNQR